MAQGHPTVAAMAAYRHLRLPFARPQTLQTLQTLHKSAQLRREKVPQQSQHVPLPHAQATTRPQQWLKGTPRPQQWLLIGVQGCRLPGLKPSKRSKRFQKSAQLRREKVPQQAQHAPLPHAKATTRPQQWLKGHPPAAAMASYRRSRLPFCQASNPPNAPKVRPAPQGKGTPTSPTRATPCHAPTLQAKATRPQQWLKGTPRPQQWL